MFFALFIDYVMLTLHLCQHSWMSVIYTCMAIVQMIYIAIKGRILPNKAVELIRLTPSAKMKLVIFFLCLGVALAHEKGAFEHIAEVNMDAGIADELFEGDIKLTSEQRGGVNNLYYRWPNARVPYVIDGSLGMFLIRVYYILNVGINSCYQE
ncbi:PREDICTED: uncharacterized protein LOC106820681 [Priapulus caudatus]|uniref:Uncharacterized protein LOC106820681 n=1 Tax=Priapulus caudatus TaxID=37621 RepID=A0ABM1F899_PRICU|nr:PREDICTED: uncharacterized protein LOC106820681 [Priapulus caudatus]